MGCDIHLKSFVFSKVENRYVAISSVMEDADYNTRLFLPKFHFVPFVDGERYYDFFGMMGNGFRSYYPEMDCFEGNEFPDFMKDMTIYRIANSPDYHTRRWCYANKFLESLRRYKKMLNDPEKFKKMLDKKYSPNDSMPNIFARNYFREFEHTCLINYIDSIIRRVEYIKEAMESIEDVVDPENIVFVTWMDN